MFLIHLNRQGVLNDIQECMWQKIVQEKMLRLHAYSSKVIKWKQQTNGKIPPSTFLIMRNENDQNQNLELLRTSKKIQNY